MKMELRKRAIDKVYKRRDRIEMPDFQREEVWPTDKKRRLLNSILRGWHLPKFYFRLVDEGTFECVDGQQRLVTIWEFYDNKLDLDNSTAKEFGGKYYKDLPDRVADAFDDFEIEIEEIEDATDHELEELFLRLQLGTPLNTAEKLNAIGGDMRDFAKSIVGYQFFKDRIALRDTRFAHFAIALQWVFVEARGIHSQMRFPQLEALLKENRSFSLESDLAKRIKGTLNYLGKAIPHRTTKLRNRANVLSVLMLSSKIYNAGLHKGTEKKLGKFIDDFFDQLAQEVEKGPSSTQRELLEYQEAISYGSTGGDSINARLQILIRRLVIQFPEFSPLLGDTISNKNFTKRSLETQKQSILELLYKINEHYSAVNGEDLFKLTNETLAATNTLDMPINDVRSYGDFIDALYKLFYEGSGACKRLPNPPPDFAMDVKFLRTGIRHDLDHGPESDVKKKRQRKGGVFKKYSSKETVDECGPEDFLALQYSLLDKCQEFLEELLER